MGKPLEMYEFIFLQSMVQIRARNVGFTTKILFRFFCILSLGALVAESPQEGAIKIYGQIHWTPFSNLDINHRRKDPYH